MKIDIFQVTDPGCCGVRRIDEDGCCVTCGIDFCDPETGEEEGDGTRVPNARLIDASLDMLEALEFVAKCSMYPGVAVKRVWSDAVFAAIAKAKGEV